jgi:hypothetical protein
LEIIMSKILGLAVFLLLNSAAFAQTNAVAQADLSYTYAELRYVDYDDNGGDGFRINGSFDLGNNWLIVGGLTSADFNNNVDADMFEIGGGYVWNYTPEWDLVATARFVKAEFDTPGGSSDDSGIAIAGGTRGFLAPKFELRGFVHHINLDNSDTYIELAGDYHFTPRLSAGLSVELAGDSDLLSIGARWFFR